MPTYQYACTACAHRLEAVQSFTDDPLTQCPVCAGRLRKLFGSVGIVFKGPGFYRTDSRAAANGNGKAGGKGSAESGSGESGSGDAADGGKAGTKDAKDKTPVGAASPSSSSTSGDSGSSSSNSGSGSAGSSSSGGTSS